MEKEVERLLEFWICEELWDDIVDVIEDEELVVVDWVLLELWVEDVDVELDCVELELLLTAGAAQYSACTKAEFKVIEAPNANNPPWLVASAFTVIDTADNNVPAKSDPKPSVAEVPTFQNTLQACAPPANSTVDPMAVVNIEPIWKYHASVALPVPRRVKIPLNCADEPYL